MKRQTHRKVGTQSHRILKKDSLTAKQEIKRVQTYSISGEVIFFGNESTSRGGGQDTEKQEYKVNLNVCECWLCYTHPKELFSISGFFSFWMAPQREYHLQIGY